MELQHRATIKDMANIPNNHSKAAITMASRHHRNSNTEAMDLQHKEDSSTDKAQRLTTNMDKIKGTFNTSVHSTLRLRFETFY